MQPPTDGPRAGLTTTQVAYLLEQTDVDQISCGMELLDPSTLAVTDDISQFLAGGSVSRNNYASIHGAATFTLQTLLNWGRAVVRPYYTITGALSSTATTLTTVRFNLGAYFTEVGETDLSESPPTFEVTGHDILSLLDDAVGDAYTIAAGVDCLQRVEDILTNRGVPAYIIDHSATGKTLPSSKTYTLDDNVTWLTVINDLLATIGYQGIWSDWNGYYRIQPYVTPSARTVDWVHGVDDATTLIGQAVKSARDLYDAPNRWVFYRQNNTDSGSPVDGDGRYEYINSTIGPTSVNARGGRTITKTVGVDVTDQAGMIASAQATIDADIAVPTRFSFETFPFPLAWHFDKYTIQDPRFGAACDVLGSAWTLPLDGSNQTHEMTLIQ